MECDRNDNFSFDLEPYAEFRLVSKQRENDLIGPILKK